MSPTQVVADPTRERDFGRIFTGGRVQVCINLLEMFRTKQIDML